MDEKTKIALCKTIINASAEYGIDSADEFRAMVMCLEVILDFGGGTDGNA